MFWECHVVISSIDKLLDQPSNSVSLQDFLDENDLIQECLTQNDRLLDYLVQENIMKQLIGCIKLCPTDNNFHNAQVVSELLSGDFQRIQEKLLEKENLDLLYSFLLSHEPNDRSTLNPILASYFSRIIMTLVIRRPQELITYLKSRETFKNDFFRHLDSTSITDVLYRLIADCGEQRSQAIKWYEDINLIDGLIEQLLTTESAYIQMNIVNLLGEFIRLAFDQHNGSESDFQQRNTNTTLLSSANECLPDNAKEYDEESTALNRFSSNNDDVDDNTTSNRVDGNISPLILAQHILSKSNLEKLFDALSNQPGLVAHGCDFIVNIFDLLGRYMAPPLCIPITSFVQEKSISKHQFLSDKDDNERMQIDDEGDVLPVIKSNEKSSDEMNRNTLKTLSVNIKDPRIQIYLTLLEVIPSRLSSLIALLSTPSAPLIPSSPSHDSSQTVKYQFISEPLGAMRLNLIKFFSKLIHTISNDCTGDYIYQILNSNRLLYILIDLFYHHIYNNFLHTQVYMIIRLILHINSLAVKQPNDIWTRIPLNEQIKPSDSEFANSSSIHYSNRCSYKLFQSLLSGSEVNLIERLLDQYELNVASSKSVLTSSSSDDAITSSLLHTRFTSPNSGHVIQMLRCLREHAPTFNNYSVYLKNNDQEQFDENTNLLEIRWETGLDYLNEDEKKCLAMHHQEQNSSNSFRLSSATHVIGHNNDSSEAIHRRQTFHMRSFGSSGPAYIDDDDDDDVSYVRKN
ncbi:unnamed protein product [Rotaria socialis]|uniref:Uncharacterized protein n=1 Tax=Rotaria socialis TaxID=392032 RepID=A0A818AWK0_9BILA|nr:unnamed protein product [Rotaria socialis]CAF3752966.1 unnamed protein product [Rotaria socialis]